MSTAPQAVHGTELYPLTLVDGLHNTLALSVVVAEVVEALRPGL